MSRAVLLGTVISVTASLGTTGSCTSLVELLPLLDALSGFGVGSGVPGTSCSNTCDFARDAECDDGGPGSLTDLCALGSDCFDCGARDVDVFVDSGCSDTCDFAGDGECDDGGADADTDACAFGTDCTDCGPR